MESQTPTCSFLSRLALPGLMSLILLAPAIARADVFYVSGTALNFSGGKLGSCAAGASCPFSGMFTVDTTTGTVESTGLDVTLPGLPDFDTLFFSGAASSNAWEIGATNSAGDSLSLAFITAPTPASLVGFTEGSIVGGGDEGHNYIINSGGSIAPVPEPTSLVLLAGVIGWVVGMKRRVRQKSAIH